MSLAVHITQPSPATMHRRRSQNCRASCAHPPFLPINEHQPRQAVFLQSSQRASIYHIPDRFLSLSLSLAHLTTLHLHTVTNFTVATCVPSPHRCCRAITPSPVSKCTAGSLEPLSFDLFFDSPSSVTGRLTRELSFLSLAKTNTPPPVRRLEVAARREVSQACEKGKEESKKNQKRRKEEEGYFKNKNGVK